MRSAKESKLSILKRLRIVQALILGICLTIPCTRVAAQENKTLVLSKLTDKIYIAEDYYLSKENSLVYIGASYVTVVGATWTPETARLLAAEVARITSKPIKEVINTNHDLDRVGGNSYFKSIGARIISTTLIRDLLKQEGKRSVEIARQNSDYPNVEVVLPDTAFQGDFTLQDGSVRGFYLGPSHKADDIFVYFPNEKVLYGGCILKEQLGNTDGIDRGEYPKTLQKLKNLKLPINTIISGHFSPVHGSELIDQFLQLLAKMP